MKSLIKGLFVAGAFVSGLSVAGAEELVWQLDNQSSHNVNYLYVSTPDQEEWSEDFLGEDVVVPAGSTATVTITDANDICIFDIQFINDKKRVLESYAQDLCGGVTITLSDAE